MSLIPLGFWAASGGGGGAAAFDLLETTTLTSDSSVTFTGLGSYSDYKHLQMRIICQGNFPTTSNTTLGLRFNADTGSNYSRHRLGGNGSSVSSNNSSNATSISLTDAYPNKQTNIFGAIVIDILDFSNTSKNTTIRALTGSINTSATDIALHSGAWYNTNAVTSISCFQTYSTGSRFSLYGVK